MSDTAPFMQSDATESLPEALGEVIRCVVRKTRLWPSEKRDVQAELESHFREGLIELTGQGMSVGESVEVLRDGFGDPELTAKLIRRGKKRGRSMFWKIIVGTALTGLGGVGAGAAYVGYLWLAEPNPTVNYVAKINEPVMQIPEGDRSWPILRDAILQMTSPPEIEAIRSTMPLPGEATWPEAMTWVSQNQHLLPVFMRAADMPAYGFVYDNKTTAEFLAARTLARGEPASQAVVQDDPLAPPTICLILPHLSDYRDAGRLLLLAARNELYHGDFVECWKSLDSVHRLGAQLLTGQTLIEQLVGRAMMGMATQEMRRVLYDLRASLTPEQLVVVGQSQAMTMSPDSLKPNYEGEKLFFHDIVQYLFTDDGSGNGRLIPSQFEKIEWMGRDPSTSQADGFHREGRYLHIAAVHADRITTIEKYLALWDRMHELLRLPLHDPRREDAGRLLDATLKGEPLGRFAVIHTLLPNLSYADASMREGAMELRALRTIFALLQFRDERGMFPTRLSDLVPTYLSELPTDAYSGQELRYDAAAARGPRLYSVGRNMKDDNASTEAAQQQASGRAAALDLVYWPEDRLK